MTNKNNNLCTLDPFGFNNEKRNKSQHPNILLLLFIIVNSGCRTNKADYMTIKYTLCKYYFYQCKHSCVHHNISKHVYCEYCNIGHSTV